MAKGGHRWLWRVVFEGGHRLQLWREVAGVQEGHLQLWRAVFCSEGGGLLWSPERNVGARTCVEGQGTVVFEGRCRLEMVVGRENQDSEGT